MFTHPLQLEKVLACQGRLKVPTGISDSWQDLGPNQATENTINVVEVHTVQSCGRLRERLRTFCGSIQRGHGYGATNSCKAYVHNDCLGSAPECAMLEHDECTQLSVVQVLVKVHVDVEWEPTVVYRKLGTGLLTQRASRHHCLFSL